MKTIVKNLMSYFGFKIKVDSKKVRRSMYSYFTYKDWGYSSTITKVETTEGRKGLVVLVETSRPGILIGKAGVFIDGMEEWLKKDLKRNDISIHLKESKLWTNLY